VPVSPSGTTPGLPVNPQLHDLVQVCAHRTCAQPVSGQWGLTASLAGRGTCGLSAGAQITPAATTNQGAKTMKRTTARCYPVLLLRNTLGRFMSLRVPQVHKPRRRRITRPAIVITQLALF
jgi:hypothetical protein